MPFTLSGVWSSPCANVHWTGTAFVNLVGKNVTERQNAHLFTDELQKIHAASVRTSVGRNGYLLPALTGGYP
jgi:hypothetical protein